MPTGQDIYLWDLLNGYGRSTPFSELLVSGRTMDGAPPTGWERLSTPHEAHLSEIGELLPVDQADLLDYLLMIIVPPSHFTNFNICFFDPFGRGVSFAARSFKP